MMAGNHLTETFVYKGGSRGWAWGTWAFPYFWTKLRPKGPKKFFWETGPPPYLRVWMTPNTKRNTKTYAFPFTRTVQTVQIANSPSPKNIYVTFFTLGRHVNALSHERFIEILAKNPFEVKIFLKYKFLAALKHRFMKVKT